MIYMLNLVFDASDAAESDEARFMEYDPAFPPLQQSKIWLQQTDPKNPQPKPDNPADWELLELDSADPLTLVAGDQTWVRICGLFAGGSAMAAFQARVTIIVARSAGRASHNAVGKPFQTRGSPFAIAQKSARSGALFETGFQAPTDAGSWVQQQLGPVLFTTPPPKPKPPHFHDAYSVVVAATVGQVPAGGGDPTNQRTYSHDPDMDVNC